MAKTNTTDIVLKYEGQEFHVPEGFSVEEYRQSLIAVRPELATAQMFKDGPGVYTLKSGYKQKS